MQHYRRHVVIIVYSTPFGLHVRQLHRSEPLEEELVLKIAWRERSEQASLTVRHQTRGPASQFA
jgi:hypothetical protein